MKIITIIAILLLTYPVYAQPMGKGIISISEEDGSPEVFPWQIKVNNGDLTDNGDGTASFNESDPNVDTEAEIEAITGAYFGTSKAVTSGYIWVADGTDFESVAMVGDVTIASGGATTVADDSHNHVYSNIDSTTSANWASIVSDETGSGAWVFGTSPQFTTSIGIGVAPWEALTVSGDVVISDASPRLTFRDSTDNSAYTFHHDSALNYFTLTKGTESGAGFTATSMLLQWDSGSNLIINESGLDQDLRIEGDGEANLFYLDAGNDRIGIGTDAPTSTFDIRGTCRVPNSTNDLTLTNAGEIGVNETDDQISVHFGSTGEITGEAAISGLRHFSATFDPAAMYDQDATNHNLPLFTVGDDAPEGITIDEWQCTYSTGDPTTELGAKLYYADDWSWTNETEIDDISTLSGSSSEDTDANINSGNAVANGKKIYIGFTADPTDSNVLVIFEMFFHNEED